MASEEKELELSIEEMKNAVALSNFLPELLNIIQEMNNRMSKIDDNLTKQAVALNNYVKTVGECITQISTLISKLDNDDKNKKEFEELNNKLNGLKSTLDKNINQVKQQPKTPKPSTNESGSNNGDKGAGNFNDKEKVYTAADLEYYSVFSQLLKDNKGKKSFLLTPIIIKNTYRCSDDVANRIVNFYKRYNCISNNMTNTLSQKAQKELSKEMGACHNAQKQGKIKK